VKKLMPGLANCGWSISFGNNGKKISCFCRLCFGENCRIICYMKTRFGLPRLAGWMGRCGVALIALAFCASAFADPSKNVVAMPKASATKAQTEAQRLAFKKQLYIFISSSGIPQPLDRVAGPIPTTVVPMFIAGNHE
jgi:hypothetical protein